ncbi:PQQ-binding-like beta-propeller repeat protein [Streptomyces sp. BG9H]|uniref:PQQ-binding-like beta-propeller repeat protein n=1 Tax=Streptomyces anatolicus TaxID=2675858 RepID=A0ABS6YPY2_9ACTN|nr:PQQ-binding-like beta-propeller repeat protein [Streptomyces anatolicus]MBW5423485.1 PQQ-binding-like beta-propeller repeat protein [Streptomyces anatolicus]
MNHHSMRLRGLAAVAALILTAGCGGAEEDGKSAAHGGDAGKSAVPKGPAMREVKAPVRFSTGQAVALPDSAGAGNVAIAGLQHPLPVALHKGMVVITRPDGMEIANGYRDAEPSLITPKHEPLTTIDDLGAVVGSNPARRPIITEHEGKILALSSLVADVPGSGTTKGHHEVELIAAELDADAGKAAKAWSARIPLAEFEYSLDVDEEDTEVVGVTGGIAAVYAQGKLFGVDLGSHRKVWTAPGTYADGAVLAGGKLVALRDHEGDDRRPVGLDPADGRQKWVMDELAADDLTAAGPGTVIVGGYLTGDDEGEKETALIDAATRKKIRTFDETAQTGDCAYDGRSTTVCTGGDSVTAYDPGTGKVRWALPDKSENRVAPKVTLVRAGLVYGTTENGPVVLDATTGADKEDNPGIAPYFSDGYVGIALAESDNTVTAYRVER